MYFTGIRLAGANVGSRLAHFLLVVCLALGQVWATPAASGQVLTRASGKYIIDQSASRIGFFIAQIGGGGIRGSFGEFSGRFEINSRNLSKSRVEIEIDPASVSTGTRRVEEFIRGKAVLNAKRNPVVWFKSTRVTQTGLNTALLEGVLKARGREKPAEFTIEFVKKRGRAIEFHVTGNIRRTPYDMQIGVPIFSNIVRFDMSLTGTRR